jgi:hypothetical protein
LRNSESQKVSQFFKKVRMFLKKFEKVRKFLKKIEKVNLPLSVFRLLALSGGLGLGCSARTGRSLAADDLELKRLRRGSLPRREEGYVEGVRYTLIIITHGRDVPSSSVCRPSRDADDAQVVPWHRM